nr:PepSY-like domain-containing protein [uncultured Dyadobacter sp.]
MKKLALFLTFLLFVVTACDKEKVVDEADLPVNARDYIEAHFPGSRISQVVKDRDDLETSYDVILDNQVKLEFDKKGEVYSIESRRIEKLPDTVIPLKVLEYVQKNYPDAFITDWDKDRTDQEIRLSNNKELVFNLAGTFLRIDD